MSCIYVYAKEAHKQEQIHSLCRKMGITVKDLSVSDLRRTVGEIVGEKNLKMPGNAMWNGAIPPMGQGPQAEIPFFYQMPDFLLFDRLEDTALDRFLEAYREAQIPATPYKAVVTLPNRSWTLYHLIEAIRQEHESK